MSKLTALEDAALSAIFDEVPHLRAALCEQLAAAKIVSREYDAGGFFTYFSVGENAPSIPAPLALGEKVHARIDGLQYGVGFVLILKNGRMHVLDCYAVGDDTTSIDFATVPFRISETQFDA
jgi:hypothetical protein